MIKSKCCDLNCFIQEKGNNTGLYCSKCGKWQKWLNKDEINLFNHEQGNNIDSDYYKNKIIELIDNINKEVEREFSKELISVEDNLRKSSYCYGLDKVRLNLENILEGE